MSGAPPLISIIIPSYNCMDVVGKCVDSLLKLKWENKEIIVVDDGSTDGTPEVLGRYGKAIRVIRISNGGPSRARNIAVRESRGEFIAFTDSDCIVSPDWLDELMKGFGDERVAGVGGDQQSPEDESEFGKKIHALLKAIGFTADYVKGHKSIVRTRHNPTCNVLYRRTALMEAGLFDENLWPGEDVDIDLKIARMGYIFYYNPKAVVHHYRPKNLRSFARMMRRYGWAQVYLVKKYGAFRPIHFEPLLGAGLAAGLVLFALLASPAAAGLASLAILAAVILFFIIKAKGVASGLSLFRLFLVLLFEWNAGYLKGIITKVKK